MLLQKTQQFFAWLQRSKSKLPNAGDPFLVPNYRPEDTKWGVLVRDVLFAAISLQQSG